MKSIITKNIFNKSLFFILTFLTYSIWKFFPSFELGISVSAPDGDGLGTIAYFSELVEQIELKSFSYFLSDLTRLDLSGLGVYPSAPINIVQKVIIYTLSFFAELDNLYDSYAFLSFFIFGVSSFFLFRELKINFLVSMFGAFLIVNNENIGVRLNGHLTLALSFAPILLTYAVVKAAKHATLKRLFLISIATVFNFSMNEYYGYFGIFYAVFLFIGLHFYYNSPKDIIQRKNLLSLLKKIGLTSLLLIVGMSLFYPNLVGSKFLGFFLQSDLASNTATAVQRTYPEFIEYSIRNHSYFFSPNLELFKSFFNQDFFEEYTFYEQSFRIGLFAPLFLFLFYYSIGITLFFKKQIPKKVLLPLFLLPAIIVLFLLSNNPKYGLSLVPFTYTFSQIFRVGSRAYLYILIPTIITMLLCLDYFLDILKEYLNKVKNLKTKLLSSYVLYPFIYSLLLITFFVDFSHHSFRNQAVVYQLPNASIYKELNKLEKGMVLEIPFFRYPENPFETGYIYYYNRSLYKSQLINATLPPNNKHYKDFSYIYDALQKPTKKTIKFLQDIGVKYIVLNEDNDAWLNITNNNNLKRIKKMGKKELLLLPNSKKLSYKDVFSVIRSQHDYQLKSDKERVPSLKPTVTLKNQFEIYSPTSNRDMLSSGFATPEGWGVWSNSTEALVKFGFKPPKFLEIEFNVFTDKTRKQTVEFMLNDKTLYKRDLTSKNNKIKLPIDGQLKEVNKLIIKTPNAISPKELDSNNSDIRKLGVGIKSILLK